MMTGVAMMPDMTVDGQKIMLEELSFQKPVVEVIDYSRCSSHQFYHQIKRDVLIHELCSELLARTSLIDL